MMKASDMVHINEEGQVIGGNKVAVNAAGFQIHSAIHKARPDLNAACHCHSVAGKAWSAFGRPLDIINQDSCVFRGIQAVYESFGGVVLEDEESEKIAAAMGDKARVIMLQNHGLLTAGSTVDEAAYLFTLMERTCQVQLMVESAGIPKRHIGDQEADFTARINADPVRLKKMPYASSSVGGLTIRRRYCTLSSSQTSTLKFGSQRVSYAEASKQYYGTHKSTSSWQNTVVNVPLSTHA
jgi:ribulose-5-phosphate 4-epimerase/fuculose-1-phosphate aldolase